MTEFANNPYFLGITLFAGINFILTLVLWFRLRRFQRIQKGLFLEEEKASLTELILKHKKTLMSHNKNLVEIGKILEELIEKNKSNIQKVGFLRYNPFSEVGGNMSFSLTLLDGHDNGIVISSLHTREGTRIYAKSIETGGSKHNLTDEEKEAITKAKN